MSRVHDMGGQTGFGPVPVEDDDGRFFHADWEARVYALIRALQRHKIINPQFDELRDAIERIPPDEYLALSYYERWLRAAEILLAEKGLLPDDQDPGTGDHRDHSGHQDHGGPRDHGHPRNQGDRGDRDHHRDQSDHGDHGNHRDHGNG
jgi:nitrile hydratase subunit beta